MADVKWIKIVTDIFDDEKMLLIESMPEADSIIVIWFKLLCMAGKQNNSGVFMLNDKIAYTDEMLATVFRRPLNTVRLALRVFEQYGMIEIVDNVFMIPNWEKHQSLDKIERAKEKNRERVAAYRERQKALAAGTSCNDYSNGTVTPSNDVDKDIDKDKEEDKEGEREEETPQAVKEPKRKRFVPPTLAEVQAYCIERKNGVDPQRFIDYYEARGWMVGKTKMKDWKAAIRTWERNGYSDPKQSTDKSYDSDSFFEAALKAGMDDKPRSPRTAIERDVVKRSMERAENPPKTAGEDEAIREKMERLKERLGN